MIVSFVRQAKTISINEIDFGLLLRRWTSKFAIQLRISERFGIATLYPTHVIRPAASTSAVCGPVSFECTRLHDIYGSSQTDKYVLTRRKLHTTTNLLRKLSPLFNCTANLSHFSSHIPSLSAANSVPALLRMSSISFAIESPNQPAFRRKCDEEDAFAVRNTSDGEGNSKKRDK